MLGYIRKADAELFDRFRKTIKTNSLYLQIIQDIRRDEGNRHREMSTRKLSRQGPWKRPLLATRALLVGVGIGLVGLFNSSGLDGEKMLLLV